MIGLSFSFCVRDIAAGRVPLEQVEKIIASTTAATQEDWEEVISDYKRFYWYDDAQNCERIARQLLAEGKVEQPRLQGKKGHHIGQGHWIKDGVIVPVR